MIDSKKNQTRVLYSWLKQYEVRGLIFGFMYVLLLIVVGQLSSQYTASSQRKAAQIGPKLELKTLLKSIPKVRREFRYDPIIKDLSAVLRVRSHYEQCPALLIHEKLIITQGDCAQSLGFDHLKGQSWQAVSSKIQKVGHLRNSSKLRAKVVKSVVNHRLKLAVHILDKALPYAPLNLPNLGLTHKIFEHVSQKTDLSASRKLAGFMVHRNQSNGKLLISGRIHHTNYLPFKTEALSWLTTAQQKLLTHEQKRVPDTPSNLMISKL